MKIFKDWTTFEKLWIFISTATMIILSLICEDTLIGLISVVTGLWCMFLTAKGKIANYYFGIINVFLYGYITYGYGLMGEVMLNWGFFLPMNFIGWYLWVKDKDKNIEKSITTKILTRREKYVGITSIIIVVIFYGFFLKSLKSFHFLDQFAITQNPSPFFDATSTVLSIIAMILLVKRYQEQWILWISIDVVCVAMWTFVLSKSTGRIEIGNAILMITMWNSYLVSSLYGRFKWSKLSQKYNRKIEVKTN